MRALAATGSAHTSMPSTQTWPPSGRSSPVAIRNVVAFPAPLGPTMPKNEPGATSRRTGPTDEPGGTSRSTWLTAPLGPNALRSPRVSSAGGAAPEPRSSATTPQGYGMDGLERLGRFAALEPTGEPDAGAVLGAFALHAAHQRPHELEAPTVVAIPPV